MFYTDGTTSRYDVLRGPMCRGGKAFNAAKADVVAQYELVRQEPDYRAMTAKHATAAAPAVYWQA